MSLKRLLFASCHGDLDPSRGAALATRDLLELFASRGVDCRVFSTGVVDFEEETPLESILDPMGIPYDRAGAVLGSGGTAEVIDLTWNGVRVTLLPTASSRADRAPSMEESRAFLDLAEQVLDRFRPQVLLTYGGHPANLELMARARRRKIAVVFHLHNFGYSLAWVLGSDRFVGRLRALAGADFADPPSPEARRLAGADAKGICRAVVAYYGLELSDLSRRRTHETARLVAA